MTTALFGPVVRGQESGGGPPDDLLDQLSPRELEVLALMAEGRSNRAIGEVLRVEPKTVETHVGRVFTKLGLHADRDANRRVLAVLAFFGRARPGAADGQGSPPGDSRDVVVGRRRQWAMSTKRE